MIQYWGVRVRVLKKRGGRGDITYYVHIPKEIHANLGYPDEYSATTLGDAVLFLPVRDIVIPDIVEEKLDSLTSYLEDLLQRHSPKLVPHIYNYLFNKRLFSGGITRAIIFCKGHKYEDYALIEYRYRDKPDIFRGYFSCGDDNSLSQNTIILITQLCQKHDEETRKELKTLISNKELRGKAIVIEVPIFEKKVYVKLITK